MTKKQIEGKIRVDTTVLTTTRNQIPEEVHVGQSSPFNVERECGEGRDTPTDNCGRHAFCTLEFAQACCHVPTSNEQQGHSRYATKEVKANSGYDFCG